MNDMVIQQNLLKKDKFMITSQFRFFWDCPLKQFAAIVQAQVEKLDAGLSIKLFVHDILFNPSAKKNMIFCGYVKKQRGGSPLFEDLAAETLTTTGAKEAFLEDYLNETTILDEEIRNEECATFSCRLKTIAFIDHTMAGLKVR